MLKQVDVYHDIFEVLWKKQVSTTYTDILNILDNVNLLDDPEISGLNIAFINAFNSNHSLGNFCLRTKIIQKRLENYLNKSHPIEFSQAISTNIEETSERINNNLNIFNENSSPTEVLTDQTHIIDGQINISGETLETFASREDYIKAILRIFGDKNGQYENIAKQSFYTGCYLDDETRTILVEAKTHRWNIVDTISEILLRYQINKKPPTLQTFEHTPSDDDTTNNNKRQLVIEQAFYLMGKTISSIGQFNSSREYSSNAEISQDIDPLRLFLQYSKPNIPDQQVKAVKKITLAHCSHGLNSGELTAQLAGSVRTTFPRALIASLNVRSGIIHAGAVTECMEQTKEFLDSNLDEESYVSYLLNEKSKIYGFGHRIHKTSQNDPETMLGKDPRVDWYINSAKEGFPRKIERINKLVSYAQCMRKVKPDLGANADFGATVLFHCLDLPPQVATGFFMAFRIPGLCARIVNELQFKSNSRRPPFPMVLPYPSSR